MKYWLILMLLWTGNSAADEMSNGFVHYDTDTKKVQVSLAIRDLALLFPLDGNLNGELTWGELKLWQPSITHYIQTHIQLTSGKTLCTNNKNSALAIDNKAGVAYAVVSWEYSCSNNADLTLQYSALYALNANHRAIATINQLNHVSTALLSPDNQTISLDRADNHNSRMLGFFKTGAHHVWIGIDHILFLLALILPMLLFHRTSGYRLLIKQILWVISAFTLGHTVSLGLAMTGIVDLPEQWVEVAIAASIAVSIILYKNQWLHKNRTILAMLFGLIHGLGFASALQGTAVDHQTLAKILVGFNLGAEAMQIIIMLSIVTLLYNFRDNIFMRFYAFSIAQMTMLSISLLWVVERSTGTEFSDFVF